jgi:hypothetical protein
MVGGTSWYFLAGQSGVISRKSFPGNHFLVSHRGTPKKANISFVFVYSVDYDLKSIRFY